MSDDSPAVTDVNLDEMASQLDVVMLRDRFRLSRWLDGIRRAKREGKPFDRNLKKFRDLAERSMALRERRAASVPTPSFPDDLPVCERLDEIQAAIESHPVVIVCGETGSGKSTQLPKLLLRMGRGVTGVIGHTQPRRLAARSVATRIAQELSVPVGKQVGFKVRFADATAPETLIKLMTDGVLLAETQSDRFLEQYDTIIIDEAHERSLNIDFLLGLIKRILKRRSDLKLIVTSATIDASRFSEHFVIDGQPAPVIEVSGRTYPVEVRYRPLAGEEGESDVDPVRGVCEAVSEIATESNANGIGGGDILVFLPTERDIRETAKVLRGWNIPGDAANRSSEILPLYGRLSNADQQRIFQSADCRRIVLATNVAESSLTVPGIRAVVDTGTARISRYSAHSKVQRLPIEPVSQASADQRKGRCGRIGPGLAIRLFSEEDYTTRDRFTAPEIQRTNLASVILQTAALGLGKLDEFPFLDPPKPVAIRDGYKTLIELQALTDRHELTEIGRTLAKWPVDPRIGRMILAASERGCLREVLIIASALEIQDPRERPVEKQQAADEAHAKFQHERSDFLSYLKLWDLYHVKQDELSRSKMRKWCRQTFLSHNRMREWLDVHRQLRQFVREAKLPLNTKESERGPEQEDAIHQSLMTGLLSNIAQKTATFEYTGSGGKKLHLWPGSGVFKAKPQWIMAAELIETSKRFARTVAKINPEWIEPIAEHLIKTSYTDPYWSSKSGSAMVYASRTLFGLPIVKQRPTRYGPMNPSLAREMFIQHALVEDDWQSEASFLIANRKLKAELEELVARNRRPDLLLGEEAQFEFYDRLLPEHVVDSASFSKWRRKAERKDPELLYMRKGDLYRVEENTPDESDFPRSIQAGSLRLSLEYHLEPGSEEDGITISIPQEAINQLHQQRLGWLVPGLLEEKIVTLIKSLPKHLRRQFVPAPETAKLVKSRLKFGQGEMLDQVATELTRIAGGVPVKFEEFNPERLPNHLRMNVRVLDAEGEVVRTGRDIPQIRQQLAASAADNFQTLTASKWHREGLTGWDFETLPEVVQIEKHGVMISGYPALVDAGRSVTLKLLDTKEKAEQATRAGLRRLMLLAHRKTIETQVTHLPQMSKLKVLATVMGGATAFREQVGELLADRALFAQDATFPRNKQQFDAKLKRAKGMLSVVVQDVIKILSPIMEGAHQTKQILDTTPPSAWQVAVDDMRSQLRELVRGRFLIETPWEWLYQYPRYFHGIRVRHQKLKEGGLGKDRQRHEQLKPHWRRYLDRRAELQRLKLTDPRLDYYRWLLEEFRISLFAQTLRTAVPVSASRLDRQWEKTASVRG